MKRREELDKLNDMSDEELRDRAAELKEALFRQNFKLALGEMDAVKTLRRDKRTLARLNTLLTQRQIAQTEK